MLMISYKFLLRIDTISYYYSCRKMCNIDNQKVGFLMRLKILVTTDL